VLDYFNSLLLFPPGVNDIDQDGQDLWIGRIANRKRLNHSKRS